MQVILLENIKKLGAIGEKVTVKDGYARNFLLKNKKALVANKKNTEYFEQQKSEINKKNEIEKNKANETFQILNNAELEVFKEAMENGQLYGSINIKEIVTLIKEQKNLDIAAEKIETKGQLKNKKALVANKKNTEYFEQQKSEINKKNEIEKNKANETFQVLNNAELEIYKEAMENGQLYGSINIKEIVTLIKEQKDLDISAEKIETRGQLKNAGISKVYINLHAEVIATINLNVKPKVE